MKLFLAVKRCLFVICFVALVVAQGKAAGQAKPTAKPCTNAEADQAIDNFAYANLHSWNDIYRSFQRFAHCDDGAIAEGFSGRIGWLLVHDWKHFSDLNHFVRLNPVFKTFVISHIDETTSFQEWRLVQQNARLRCPVTAKPLCRTIDKAIDQLKPD